MDIMNEISLYRKNFNINEETDVFLQMNKLYAMIKGTDILNAGRFHEPDFYAAKEGKHIMVMDDNMARINSAKRKLVQYSDYEKNVTLIQADFLQYDFIGKRFDAVVMADVLQYVLFPGQWIKKAFNLLKEDGVFLSAVPFGFYPDTEAKKTYFLLDFLELVEPFGPVEDYGIWDAGMSYLMAVKKKNYQGMLLDMRDIIGKSEKAFLKREKIYYKVLHEKQTASLQ